MAAIRAALIAGILLLAVLVAVPLAWLAPVAATAAVRLACRAVLALLRIVVRQDGSAAPALLVGNHVSWIDILVVLASRPVCFLAKSEVGGWPLVASLARAQGTVFVDRRRRRLIPAVNAAMAGRLAEGRAVMLFPEGTTHDRAGCAPFHTAHLASLRSLFAVSQGRRAAQVQPVSLRYSDPAVAWIGDDALLPHLWRLLRRPAITCDLRFGAPITVAPGYDRKALGRVLRGRVEAMLAEALLPAPAPALARDRASPVAEGASPPQGPWATS